MRSRSRSTALAVVCAGVLAFAACGSGGSSDESGGSTTITWWHSSDTEPGKGFYEQTAQDYEADHPGVKIEISAMAHEDMVAELDAAFQSGDIPDIYVERGGGELADHVSSGLVRDLSDDASEEIAEVGGSVAGWQIDGKTYALPFSMGVSGVWYNTGLFDRVGISAPPTTMDEWYGDIAKLKDAGITPISVGVGEKWPAAHYWYYAALRSCPEGVLSDAVTTLDFSDPCFVRAGEVVAALIATQPFNAGFLATKAQQGATSASGLLARGKVAMEMQGHWEPAVMQGLTDDGKGLGNKTGWFPFPAVEGGQSDPADALGGGDAWAVSEDAPDEAVDFVKYLLSDDVQKGFAAHDLGLPTNPAANGSVSDPALAGVLAARDDAPYVQLYFDTAFGAAVGGAMNDEIALLFAGDASPQDVVDATQQAADQQK